MVPLRMVLFGWCLTSTAACAVGADSSPNFSPSVGGSASGNADDDEGASSTGDGEVPVCGDGMVSTDELCDESAVGAYSNATCLGCVLSCDEGFGDCDPAILGCETPTDAAEHCGSCGKVCLEGTLCEGGTCGGTVLFESDADALISADASTTNFGSATKLLVDDSGCIGVDGVGGVCRTFIGAQAIEEIPPGAQVVSAQLQLECLDAGGGVRVHLATGDWVESEITWTNSPQVGAQVGTIDPCDDTDFIDVTAAVADWVSGTVENHGLVLVTDSSNGSDFASRESGNPPRFRVELSY